MKPLSITADIIESTRCLKVILVGFGSHLKCLVYAGCYVGSLKVPFSSFAQITYCLVLLLSMYILTGTNMLYNDAFITTLVML